jgi:tetratricopeptide (TPR) repeat protein
MRAFASKSAASIGTALLLSVCVAACGGSKEETRGKRTVVGMSLTEAKDIVAALEAQQAKTNEADPLRKPASGEDLLNILKKDEIDLFAAGAAYAATVEATDPKALALHAQIELAWGEAHLILAELFHDASTRLRQSLRTLNTRLSLTQTDEQKARIADIKKTIEQCDTVSDALNLTAAEHVAIGAKLAQQVITKNPDDYVGYRLAADFYRLRGEWDLFEGMVKKIEATNPESNGLVFLRGTAALQRDGRPSEAADLFRQALAKDPQFTRAQAQLVLSRPTVEDTFGELEKLRALNGNHQIVVWAGPAITAAYNARASALSKRAGGAPGKATDAANPAPAGGRANQ